MTDIGERVSYLCGCGNIAEWHFKDDHYCQLCWEAHCSHTWWNQFQIEEGE